ncbi:hypothetical protein MMC18_005467 [Xylographa bjoerkii]|nr:hypothetical protein [Xylographa bjoerkii]
MADLEEDNAPVNSLALDGGGIRGVSELLILDEIMRRLQYDLKLDKLPLPCDYFHLIGGTGTGGYGISSPATIRAVSEQLKLEGLSLVALMLGRLRMSTSEALEQYNVAAQRIFCDRNRRSRLHDGIFIAKTLENEVKRLVDSRKADGEHSTRMLVPEGDQNMGKTFVCAMPALNMAFPRLFRSYRVRNNSSANCEIWEAARATTAVPTFFERVYIGEGQLQEEFINGGLRCNNPTQEVLEEAKEVLGKERAIGCVVSIGTGHTGVISLPKPGALQNIFPSKLIEVLAKIATDCETTAAAMTMRFGNQDDIYYRLNVTHGVGLISLEEWNRMGEVQTHTKAYLQDLLVSRSVDALVVRLRTAPAWNPVRGLLVASGRDAGERPRERRAIGSHNATLDLAAIYTSQRIL